MARGPLLAVTWMNLQSLPARWGPALVAVVGIAGVVMVLTATLAMAQGFKAALNFAGAQDVAVIVRGGSSGELSSSLLPGEATVVVDGPGIRRDGSGPIASPELYVLVDLPMLGSGTAANVPFRGVGPRGVAVRDHFRIVAGRMFEPGLNEVIIGRGAAAQFRGLKLGETVRFGNQRWRIVGLFEDDGSVTESELWTDVHVLQGAYRRQGVQSVRARLDGPDSLARLAAALKADPRLNVSVATERAFYSEQSKALVAIVTTLGSVISIMMGIGAIFGAINTMYSAVAARTREIATLRAVGFGAGAVVASVLAEALLLGLAGGLLGGIAAWVFFDGIQTSTLNFQTFSQLTFAFMVTPGVFITGIVYAVVLGFIGGLLPGLRAARMPITDGLRAT
jgi:putative ABC transport system permease protein